MATDGTNFLVTWFSYTTGDLSAVRIDAATGARLGATVVLANPSGVTYSNPLVVFDGSRYVLAFVASSGGTSTLRAVRIAAADGSLVDPAPVALATADGSGFGLSFDGTNLVVAYGLSGSILATRVRPGDLAALDPSGIVVAQPGADLLHDRPSIANDALGHSLIVWSDGRADAMYHRPLVYAARLGADGSHPDGAGFRMSTAADDTEWHPRAAFDGANFVVTWSDELPSYDDVTRIARVDLAGAILDPGGVELVRSRATVPATMVVRAGARLFLAMVDPVAPHGGRVRVDAIDRALTNRVPEIARLAERANAQGKPKIASCGGTRLVVFLDNRIPYDPSTARAFGLYAVRVRASDGAVIDPVAIPIATAPRDDPRFTVTASADTFLVAYADRTTVYGVRVRASDGVVLDPTPFVISTYDGSSPDDLTAASDGSKFLVAWTDGRNRSITQTGANPDVFMNLVSSTGTVSDRNGVPFATGLDHQKGPVVVWNGSTYVIVFRHWSLSSADVNELRARKVTASGSASGSAVTVATDGAFDLAVGGGRIALVRGGGTSAQPGTIVASFLDANLAAVGTQLVLGSNAYEVAGPYVAWNGSGFFVTWFTAPTVYEVEAQPWGARFTSAGVLVDAAPVALGGLVPDPFHYGGDTPPAFGGDVAWLGDARWLVTYPAYDPTPNVTIRRAVLRVVEAAFPSPPGSDAGASDAGSGGGGGVIRCSASPRSVGTAGVLPFAALLALATIRRAARSRRSAH